MTNMHKVKYIVNRLPLWLLEIKQPTSIHVTYMYYLDGCKLDKGLHGN